MRKLRLAGSACALVLFVGSSVGAQTVDVGVKGGLVRSTLSSAEAEALGVGWKSAPAGGAFFTVNISPMFALQPEVMYMPKGAQFTEGGVTVKVNLSYVEVPILAKLYLPVTGTSIKPHVFGGPAVGFKTGCNVSGESGGASASMTCTAATGGTGNVKSTDIGAVVGGGLDLPLGKAKAVIEGRFDLGLVNVDDSGGTSEIKNRAFAVLVGLSIPVGQGKAATKSSR